MSNIKTPTLTPSADIKLDTRVVLLDEVTGNTILNSKMSEVIDFLTPYLGNSGGGGGGGGGGGTGLTAPVMPDTAAFSVPDQRPNGAMLGYVVPQTLGSPAPTYTMTPLAGADCRPDTGDFFITDRTAFFAAIASGGTTTLSASNSQGFDSTIVTFTTMPDYVDLDDQPFYANATHDWDVLDNRQVTYDSATTLITALLDKSVEDRDLSNAQDKLNYALNSSLGVGKPAMRGTGAKGPTSGLMFYENPIHWGIRNLSFSTDATFDRIRIFFDDLYFISPSEDGFNRVDLNFPKNSMINKPILLSVIWAGSTVRARIWGAETLTVGPIDTYNQFVYPGMAFALFYANAATTGTIWCVSAVGQGRSWKDSAFNGDMGRLMQFINVLEPA